MGPEEAWGLVLVMMLSCLGLGPNRVGVFLARTFIIRFVSCFSLLNYKSKLLKYIQHLVNVH